MRVIKRDLARGFGKIAAQLDELYLPRLLPSISDVASTLPLAEFPSLEFFTLPLLNVFTDLEIASFHSK